MANNKDWDGDRHVATLLAMTHWGWGLPSRYGGIAMTQKGIFQVKIWSAVTPQQSVAGSLHAPTRSVHSKWSVHSKCTLLTILDSCTPYALCLNHD